MGLFSKTKTFDPMSAFTEQQRQSIEALQGLAATGSGGGLTLGTPYGGALGAFDLTDQSLGGLSGLEGLLSGAQDPTSDIGKARTTFTDLADTTFDPSDPKTGYAAFSRALAREGREAENVLERESAITGDRFGTAIAGEKADLAARMQDMRGQQLAQIYQGTQATRLAGAQGLTGLADQIAQLSGLNVTYGDMQRQIADEKALRELGEFKRQRNEELSRIGLMGQVTQTPLGQISTKSPTAFSGLVSSVLGAAGTAIGGPIGGAIGGAIGGGISNIFGGGTTTNPRISPIGGLTTSGIFSGALSSLSGGK